MNVSLLKNCSQDTIIKTIEQMYSWFEFSSYLDIIFGTQIKYSQKSSYKLQDSDSPVWLEWVISQNLSSK